MPVPRAAWSWMDCRTTRVRGRLREVHEIVKLTDDGRQSSTSSDWRTRYDYDLLDNLVLVEDAQGNRKRLAYDGLSRKVLDDDPNRGLMTYVYDNASNLRETVDAKRQRITYEHDGVNRLVAENYHDEGAPFSAKRSPDVRYVYDTSTSEKELPDGLRKVPRNTRGRLVSVYDLSGETHMSYDARGRIEWQVKGILHPQTGELVSHASLLNYDSLDRVTALVYPDNDRVTYSYNQRGLLDAVGGGGFLALTNLDYAPSGQLTRMYYGNGVSTTYRYDNRMRLDRLVTADSRQLPLLSYAYQFDRASNIIEIGDRRPRIGTLASIPERINDQSFEYDDLYRLKRVRYGFDVDDHAASVSYRYDRIGNLLEQSSNITHRERSRPISNIGKLEYLGGRSNRPGRIPGDAPGPHAATGANGYRLDYDDNGNVVRLNDMELTWDFKDRLVSVKSALVTAEYVYDYTNRRVTKHVKYSAPHVPTETVVQYVDQHYESRDDTPVKYIYAGQTRVARFISSVASTADAKRSPLDIASTVRYYHHDHLGSTNVTTDSAGKLSEEVSYYPFGYPRFQSLPASLEDDPYKFSQKELDAESGLQYFETRYLDGSLGRFLGVDPALAMSFHLVFENPQRLNAYSYSLNRPLTYVDSNGRSPYYLVSGDGAMGAGIHYTGTAQFIVNGAEYGMKSGKGLMSWSIGTMTRLVLSKRLGPFGSTFFGLARRNGFGIWDGSSAQFPRQI